MITRERLKELLCYDRDTGLFKWRKTNSNSAVKGSNAGTVSVSAKKKYLKVRIDKTLYYCHRLVFLYEFGIYPDKVDHIDGNGLNNKINNLRSVTSVKNSQNVRISNSNTSGVMGLSWNKGYGKWHCYITVNKKRVQLGYYDDFFEACCARKSAERKYGFHMNHGSRRPL